MSASDLSKQALLSVTEVILINGVVTLNVKPTFHSTILGAPCLFLIKEEIFVLNVRVTFPYSQSFRYPN